MNEKRMHDEIEIDLGKLFCALLSKAWLIALTAVVGAVITFFCDFPVRYAAVSVYCDVLCE